MFPLNSITLMNLIKADDVDVATSHSKCEAEVVGYTVFNKTWISLNSAFTEKADTISDVHFYYAEEPNAKATSDSALKAADIISSVTDFLTFIGQIKCYTDFTAECAKGDTECAAAFKKLQENLAKEDTVLPMFKNAVAKASVSKKDEAKWLSDKAELSKKECVCPVVKDTAYTGLGKIPDGAKSKTLTGYFTYTLKGAEKESKKTKLIVFTQDEKGAWTVSEDGGSTMKIVFIVIICLFFAVILGVAIYFYIQNRKSSQDEEKTLNAEEAV